MLAIHRRNVSAFRASAPSKKFLCLGESPRRLAGLQVRSGAAATRFLDIASRRSIGEIHSATDRVREYFRPV
jgi:hypothetical protein